MANPQTRNGHVEIANDIWEALMGGGFKKNEYRIIFCILRYSYGIKTKYANLKKKEISILTRIPLPKITETLTSLEKKNVLRISQTNGYIYFHKDYDKWQLNETLTFDDKWKLQVNETLTKNLTKRKVEVNEKLSPTFTKPNKQDSFKASKESKESIKESKPNICAAEKPAPRKTPILAKAIKEVFRYWQVTLDHPKALLSRDRIGKIRARLQDGYDTAQLKQAIDGCKASSYHMGDNDAGKVYDDIGLIFRNAEKMESFWGYSKKKERNYDKLKELYSNRRPGNESPGARQGPAG